MLRGGRYAVSLILGSAASACSLLISTSDLSSDGRGAPADGAVDDANASALDSATDSAPDSDAGSAPDADASDAWCPAAALFCDDFERSSVLGSWDRVLAEQGGTSDVATGTPFGSALRVRVPAGTISAQAAVNRGPHEALAEYVSHRSRVRITKLPESGGVNLSELVLHRSASERSTAFLLLQSSGVRLFEQDCTPSCSSKTHPVLPQLTLDVWHDVTLRIQLDTTPAKIDLEVDGVVLHSLPAATNVRPGTFETSAGFNYSTPTHGEAEAYVDRVVLEGR